MKKQLLTLLAIPILFAACGKSSDHPETENNKNENKQLVRVDAVMTPYKFGEATPKDRYRWSYQVFDKEGLLVTSSTRVGFELDPTRSYEEEVTYKYENKRLVEKKDPDYRYTYAYRGLDTIEVQEYNSKGLYKSQKREYDASTRLYKLHTFYHNSGKPEIFSTNIYGYDANSRINKIHILYRPFISGNELYYTYDEKGNMLTETFFNREKQTTVVQARRSYTYDDKGRISEHVKSVSTDFRKFKHTYEENGNLMKQDVYTSKSFEGPFQQVGVINYTYTYK
jgi:hypothetical protein